MAVLSSGAIAGIVAGCSILTSIAAGALGFWLGQKIQKIPRKYTTQLYRTPIDHAIERLLWDVGQHEISDTHAMVREVVHSLFFMLGHVDWSYYEPLPQEFVTNLRERIPCDGAADADWPLWEQILTSAEGDRAFSLRHQCLSIIFTHWLVPYMQPDSDASMSLLPPDLLSLRKRILAKPHRHRGGRTIQQLWTFFTASLTFQWEPRHGRHCALDPSDNRAPGAARIRQGLLDLLGPLVPPEGHELRHTFYEQLDMLMGSASHLAMTLLCSHQGESELFWDDPKTYPWAGTEPQLSEDDYFPFRFPGIRSPVNHLDHQLDNEPEPHWDMTFPRPVRDWIPVEMKTVMEPITTTVSVQQRRRKDFWFGP